MVFTTASAGRNPVGDVPGAMAFPPREPAGATCPARVRVPLATLAAGKEIPADTFINDFERRIG